jgi:serine/threonine protein kinase
MIIADHYSVIDEIGRGGMSTVYRAIDTTRDREVAVKVLRLYDQTQQTQRRFFNELLLTSHIQHPNMVRIHDFGVSPELGLPFIVMDLLSGVDLDAWLRDHGALQPARLISLFSGLLGALAEVHARSAVHKDIKPANIFFSNAGAWNEALILTDFGIAHSMQSSRTTPTGLLACTPQYSTPEYLIHQVVCPASDVYQMGLVFLEALLGHPLVNEANVALCVLAHCEGRLKIPRLLQHGPLSELIQGTLARDPNLRFPDAATMRDALLRVDVNALTLSLDLVALSPL